MPNASPDLLRNARVPAALAGGGSGWRKVDIRLRDGTIAALDSAGSVPPQPMESVHDCDGGIVLPAFCDLHTHLDKGHIWPRQANPDGTFMGALLAVKADREAHWSAADIEARMEFALRCAYAHGTAAIRTHLDSVPPQHETTWPLFAALRERWAGRVELQATALVGPDHALDRDLLEDMARTVKQHGGQLGGAISLFDRAGEAIGNLVEAAGRHGLDLDLHIDESEEPDSRTLRVLADTVLETGFTGRVLAGHCCSLAVQEEAFAKETIERVARAGIAVVSLPMCNLYLQDRHNAAFHRTPRWRGVTLVNELKAAGVAVSLSSDNTRDPFYAYGDLDMVEVFRESVRIAHLDHPAEDAAGWFAAVTATPAATGGFAHRALLAPGHAADLVVTRARDLTEFLARPQSERIVLRAGAPIDTTLPDYRELDPILGDRP